MRSSIVFTSLSDMSTADFEDRRSCMGEQVCQGRLCQEIERPEILHCSGCTARPFDIQR